MSTSCENSRSSPYSNDLRWRLVWQVLALQLPIKKVAANLSVDGSTVRLFETTGSVNKKAYPSEKSFRKITKSAELFILHLVWPARKQQLLVRGEHISAICIMSVEGILACRIVRGSVDGETFIEFIENSLMPNVMPFNGNNSHYSSCI